MAAETTKNCEEELLQEEPDSTEDVRKNEKEQKEQKEHKKNENKKDIFMGGADFEAEQERVLHELNKQKDTIKALLDEMQQAKKERLTYNIKSIFEQKNK